MLLICELQWKNNIFCKKLQEKPCKNSIRNITKRRVISHLSSCLVEIWLESLVLREDKFECILSITTFQYNYDFFLPVSSLLNLKMAPIGHMTKFYWLIQSCDFIFVEMRLKLLIVFHLLFCDWLRTMWVSSGFATLRETEIPAGP